MADDYDMLSDFADPVLDDAVTPGTAPSWVASASDYAEGAAARNVNIADKVFAGLPLTEAGKDYVKAVMDPFHDKRYSFQGYPDGSQSATVAQVVRRAITLTKPAGLPAGASWDCHVTVTNLNATVTQRGYTMVSNTRASTIANNFWEEGIGFVTCVSVQSGDPTFINIVPPPGDIPVSTGVIEYKCLSLTDITRSIADGYESSDPYLDGLHRVLGGGVEVHNVTADLYADGAVSAYRYNGEIERSWSSTTVAAFAPGGASTGMCQTCRLPPAFERDLEYLPDTRTWKAKDGGYIVMKPTDDDLKWRVCKPQNVLMVGGERTAGNIYAGNYDAPATLAGDTYGGKQVVNDAANLSPMSFSTNKMIPGGLYFTGLNENTKLKVICKFLIERAPAPTSELATLAQPSPAFDPAVWPILSTALEMLPVGVPVADNFLGKWVSKAVNAVEDVLQHPATDMALSIAEKHGGPKAAVAAHTARAALPELRKADVEDNRAAALQHDAAKRRERAGVRPSQAGDAYAGMSARERRRRKQQRRRKRRADQRALRRARGY